MYCPNCGEEITGNFCSQCGSNSNGSTESQQVIINNVVQDTDISRKKRGNALILCLFFGWMGAHRFYVGKWGTGIIWFISFGLLGCGWVADIIVILLGGFVDNQERKLKKW